MKELVMGVVNISGQAAIIFGVLLAVRGIFALGRVPKKYAYGVWAILFIRLLLPIQMEARWGLMPRESGLARAVENVVDVAGREGQDALGNPAGDAQYVGGQDVPAEWQNMLESQDVSGEWWNLFKGKDIPEERQNMLESQELSGERWNLFEGQEIPEERQNMLESQELSGERWNLFEGQDIPEERQNLLEDQELSGERWNLFEGQDIPVERQNMHESQDIPGKGRSGGTVATAKGQSVSLAEDTGLWQLSPWIAIVGIWITGSILLMGYGLFSYFKLKRLLRCSLRLEGWGDGIYLADGIETPFTLGFRSPKIYLPSNMADKNYPYVIAHEKIHIRRRDYLFKLGAYLLTCLYWFHPLVWAGFILMGRDMEMSCDEAVLRRMDGDCRGEYADSLLQLSCGLYYPTAAPLAFGEGDTRGRIKHIMRYRKAASAVAIAAVVVTGVLAAVLLASPQAAVAEEGLPSKASMDEEERFPSEASMDGAEEGTPSEVSMDGAEQGVSRNDTEAADKISRRDITISCPVPVMAENTLLGADSAILDYVDEDKVIFHGYFGLYVYSVSAGETIGAVDLRALGCGDTQGDNACQVLVSRDGLRVYFYPLSGIGEEESSGQDYTGSWHRLTSGGEPVVSIKGLDQGEQGHEICSYVYDLTDGRLRIVSWNLGRSEDSCAEIEFSWLTGEELAECRAVPVAEVERNEWEQGFCSCHGLVFEKDGEQVFGYLKSASETLEDLVYVRRPIYEEAPTDEQRPVFGEKQGTVKGVGEWREAVRLFGANGQGVSIVSYDGREAAPRITIDGTTYDLGQVMTECRYGDGIMECPFGNTSVNAIMGLQCVEGIWIVESHMNPNHSTYSFYDPAGGEWVCHLVGTCLTWSNRDEKQALWEGNRESRLSTIIYALDNEIYSLQDGLLAFLPQEQAKRGTVSLPGEEIYGLYRDGDEITVEIRSTQTEERRTVQFHCKRFELGRGAIKLNGL